MKKWILLFTFCWIGTLGIGQIDSSAWDGKVVMVMIENLYNTNPNSNQAFNNKLKKDFRAEWYLTDSSHLIVNTSSSRNLDSFGEDTVVVVFKIKWLKVYTNKNCSGDCIVWTVGQIFEFKNFQTEEWENYIYIIYDKNINALEEFQQIITSGEKQISYKEKTIIFKTFNWSKELEALVKKKFKDLKIVISRGNFLYEKDKKEAAIFLSKFSATDFIEVIDLKTNRVLEKIKIPVSKE